MDDATSKPTEAVPLPETEERAQPAELRPPSDFSFPGPPLGLLEAFVDHLPPRITPKEREILGLIAEGLTDPEIARRLWMSVHTVHTHQVHLREKFQVRNRTALVREAQRFGYLSPDPKKSQNLSIGEEAGLGYTSAQNVEPRRSPTPSRIEDMHGAASAAERGETEMLARNTRLWYLAALLAMGAQNGAAHAKPARSARIPGAPASSAVTDVNGQATGLVARRVWSGPDVDLCGAPTPDGRTLSYVDWETGDLALRDLIAGKSRRLTGKGSWSASEDFAVHSTFSPDGKQIAYAWFDNKSGRFDLRLIDFQGGKPRILHRNEEVGYIQPAEWSPDGKQILVTFIRRDRTSQIALVSVAQGSVRILKTLDWQSPQKMSFSPDGRTIAYDFPPRHDAPARDIFLLATDTCRETPLVQHPANDLVLGWSPDGKQLLFASDRTGTLAAWRIPMAGGKPQGAPELVKPDMTHLSPLGFTRGGSYYYGVRTGGEDVYVATIDVATGKLLVPPAPATQRFEGSNALADWSPGGERLAFLSRRGPIPMGVGSRSVVIRSIASGEERELPLAMMQVHNYWLRWSGDGRSLLVTGADARNRAGFYRMDVQTGEILPVVLREPEQFMMPELSPDERAIFFKRTERPTRSSLMTRDLETGREKELLHQGDGSWFQSLALSPDGRQVAFSMGKPATRSMVLRIIPAAGGTPRELLSVPEPDTIQLNSLTWTPDGRYLIFGRRRDRLPSQPAQLWRIAAEGGEARRLDLGMENVRFVRVHPDGRRILFTVGEPRSELWVMENFLP